jgi:hypothetical protein
VKRLAVGFVTGVERHLILRTAITCGDARIEAVGVLPDTSAKTFTIIFTPVSAGRVKRRYVDAIAINLADTRAGVILILGGQSTPGSRSVNQHCHLRRGFVVLAGAGDVVGGDDDSAECGEDKKHREQ